ncbi:hypothetical protein [Microbulbifer litoralis]|uniref:hypothetical protein n=1 Tax=Microbulbifer litoralis TaxID=2933965 RepID=UPI0020297755|nr:hypothetical protein [Microbulbifer sp. GX H0434]
MFTEAVKVKVKSRCRVGQQCNLIEGLLPSWWAGSSQSPAIAPLDGQQISTEEVPPLEHSRWEKYQQVTLCENWSAFVRAFFSDMTTGGRGSAHVYALQRPDSAATANFIQWLGLSEQVAHDDSGCGFALVRKRKETLVQVPSGPLQGSEALLDAIAGCAGSHKAMLDYFNRNGTHVLGRITWGDILGQVFVYDKKHFEEVAGNFPEDQRSGEESGFFRNFTQLRDEKHHSGHVREAGRLWLASEDPALGEIAAASDDPVNLLAESIFQVSRKADLSRALYDIESITSTGFDLVPIVDQIRPPLTVGNQLDLAALVAPLTASAPVAVPAGKDTPHPAKVAAQGWLSEANARFHRYGPDGAPQFDKKSWPDYAAIYRDFQPAPVSRACTAKMSVKRPYINLDTLESEFPLYRDAVEDLIVVADVIQVNRKNLALPGRNITLICHRLVCGNEGNTAPSLRLSAQAYSGLTLHAGEMTGTLSVFNREQPRHKTLADGEIVETTGDGETVSVQVSGRIDDPLPATLLKAGDNWHADNLLEGLEFGLLSAETILGFASGEPRQVARAYATWISRILSLDAQGLDTPLDPAYKSLQLRAQTAVLNDQADSPLFVPPFSFSAYRPKIQALLAVIADYEQRKQAVDQAIRAELDAQERRASEVTMNENLRAIGDFLARQTESLGEREADVSAELTKLEEEKQETLTKLNKRLPEQLETLKLKQEAFAEAQQTLKDALERYAVEQMVMTIIDLSVGVGSLMVNLGGMADFSGKLAKTVRDAPDKFKKIVNILQKIESFIKVFKSLMDIIEDCRDINGLVNADYSELHTIVEAYAMRDGKSVIPTNDDWSDFEIELGVVTSGLPSDVATEKAKLIAEAKRMSNAAKAISSTRGKITEIGLEVTRLKWKQEVSDKHRERMDALAKTMKTKTLDERERANIDLFGISAYLEGQSSTLRLSLARTLAEHDAALQYYYLYRAQPVTRYDLTSLRKAMIDRASAALRGFSPAEYRPTDVKEPLLVTLPRSSVAELLSAEGLSFELGLNHPAFSGYGRVRTLEIRIHISGLRSPKTGRYFGRLISQNSPFYDRGLNREALDFESVPFVFNYVHDVKKDIPHTTNRISPDQEGNYNSMTPFTRWTLTLPEGGDNAGIEFDAETCDIRLEFYVNAIYSGYRTGPSLKAENGPIQRKALLASAASRPGKAELMGEMNGRSVTNNWDAACILDIAKINNLFAERYQQEMESGDQTMVREITLPQFVYTSDHFPLEEEENRADVSMQVGPPKFQLLGDGSIRASVYMDVLDGKIRKRRYERERQSEDDAWGEWEVTKDREQTIERGKNAIRCDVNLTKLRGKANPALNISESDHRIVVQLGEGTFETSVAMDGPIAAIVTSELKKYFAALESQYDYCLGVAKWDLPNTPKPLRPKKFEFTTRVFDGSTPENPKGVLILLINTDSSSSEPPARKDIDLDNDQLLARDTTASLIISSHVIFNDLIYPQLQKQWGGSEGGHTAAIVPALTDGKAVHLVGTGEIFIEQTASDWLWDHKKRDTIVPMNGFSVKGVMQDLLIEWRQDWPQEFAYYNNQGFGAADVAKVDFQLNLNARSKLQVTHINGKPSLRIPQLQLRPEITYTESSSWRKFGEIIARLIDLDQEGEKMKHKILDKLPTVTVDLGSLSLFAVSNLLFPGAKVLKLEKDSAYLPGDLWILGDVEDHFRKF